MAYEKCKQCGKKFFVDYSNPNIHYGPTPSICSPCTEFNTLPVCGIYQTSDGEYHKKEDPAEPTKNLNIEELAANNWNKINSQYKNGLNPHAHRVGFLEGYAAAMESKKN